MTWGTAVYSWEHFQVWTQAVSYTNSVNRVSDSAVSSTHNHLTVTMFSFFRFENNTQEQPLAKFQSLATSHSRYQLIQKPVWGILLMRTADHTLEVQASRGRSPGPCPLPMTAVPTTTWDNAVSGLSQIKQWRELLTATYSNPLLSCFGEQNTPHLADKTPSIPALCFGN